MKVLKRKDHVLLQDGKGGEYHFSHEEYKKLGKKKAVEKATLEIEKKAKSDQYSDKTITFDQASELGFCEYGIKDFCEKLNLDIDDEHKIVDINKVLTIDVLKEYPSECLKLFGKDCIKYLGTVEELLTPDTIYLFLRPEFISERILHELSTKFARKCLHNFEDAYPDDDRPRKAIEAKEAWTAEKIRLGHF